MKQFNESRMARNTEADSTMARANASTGTAHSDVPQHDARPTVLAFGTYNARKHPRVGILIDGLRKNGCNVEEVNHPLRLSTAQRVEILQRPWKLFGFAWNLLRLWLSLRKDARAWVRANGRPAAVLVGYMGHFDVLLAHHLFAGVPIILDHLIFAGDTAQGPRRARLESPLAAALGPMGDQRRHPGAGRYRRAWAHAQAFRHQHGRSGRRSRAVVRGFAA
jgi:hypothetical protein